jgi:hypothetical protein
MNFGKWIVVSFISFALFMGVLVMVCVQQDLNLVSKNYYQEELVHGAKMDQIRNTNLLGEQPDIRVSGNQIELKFNRMQEIENGQILFMRPSDAGLDKVFSVKPNQGTVLRFDANDFELGQYRARFKWTMQQKDYFFEKVIVL